MLPRGGTVPTEFHCVLGDPNQFGAWMHDETLQKRRNNTDECSLGDDKEADRF